MTEYPTSILPLPLIEFQSEKRGSVTSTEMETGAVRQRRRFSSNQQLVSAQCLFTYRQLALFESWVEHKIDSGASKFTIAFPDPATETLTPHTAQMVRGEYSTAPAAGVLKWRVNFTLLLDFAPLISDSELYAILLGEEETQAIILAASSLGEEMTHFTNIHTWE